MASCARPPRVTATPRYVRGAAAAIVTMVASGCVGSVGDPSASTGPGGGADLGGGGAPGGGTPPAGAIDPGRVTLHRLNRVEYNNTVRDLLGTSSRPADSFPADDRGYGFDNVADVLSISPLQMELYHAAAEALVAEALGPARRARIVSCDLAALGADCARAVLRAFGRRAWRRPLDDAEVERLGALADAARVAGATWDEALALGLQALLVSPHFLYRVELDADPFSATVHVLTDHELAARLSYFLWSTMPDEGLFAAADAGTLHDPAVLRAEVARMLASSRSQALVANFGGQWLFSRGLADHQVDAGVFPRWTASLAADLRSEIELGFRDVVSGAITLDRFLAGDETYLNDRLAAHYGLPAPGTAGLRKVNVAGTARGGFLTQGGFLAVTSYPTRTSPVIRGKWVLDNLLCEPPPAPPPGVEGLKPETAAAGTLRQRLEAHRSDPTCAACHQLMDPIGFGLEQFDGIGAYRTADAGGFPIDASGVLPDGRSFSGARELAGLMTADPRYPRCIAEKLLTYALGRGVDGAPGGIDAPTLDALARALVDGGWRLPELVAALATSLPFTSRRGDPAARRDEGGAP